MNRILKDTRRPRAEAAIRVIDMLVYLLVFVGGAYALTAPPNSVVDSLEHFEWLIILWSSLLMGGGLVGLIGRFSRRWLLETPATIAAAAGISIYVVVLWQYTFTSLTAVIATVLAAVALAFMVRRTLELQIFATQPSAVSVRTIREAMRRRTQDVAARNT